MRIPKLILKEMSKENFKALIVFLAINGIDFRKEYVFIYPKFKFNRKTRKLDPQYTDIICKKLKRLSHEEHKIELSKEISKILKISPWKRYIL